MQGPIHNAPFVCESHGLSSLQAPPTTPLSRGAQDLFDKPLADECLFVLEPGSLLRAFPARATWPVAPAASRGKVRSLAVCGGLAVGSFGSLAVWRFGAVRLGESNGQGGPFFAWFQKEINKPKQLGLRLDFNGSKAEITRRPNLRGHGI